MDEQKVWIVVFADDEEHDFEPAFMRGPFHNYGDAISYMTEELNGVGFDKLIYEEADGGIKVYGYDTEEDCKEFWYWLIERSII